MDKPYKTTWHLVIVPTEFGLYITSVYGAALLDDAEKKAREVSGFVRSLCSYGLSYHAGQTFKG